MNTSLLQGILGLFTRDNPQASLAQTLAMLRQIYSPERLSGDTNALFGLFKGSPMYRQAVNRLQATSGQAGEVFARAAATRGTSGGGIDMIRSSLGPTSLAGGMNNLDSETFQQALDSVMKLYSTQSGLAGLGGVNRNLPFDRTMRLGQGLTNTDFSWLMPSGQTGGPASLPALNYRGGGTPNVPKIPAIW